MSCRCMKDDCAECMERYRLATLDLELGMRNLTTSARDRVQAVRATVQHAGRELTEDILALDEGGISIGFSSESTKVIARTEARVSRLLAEVRLEIEAGRHLPKICSDCGLSHAPADRQRVLGRMLPASFAEVSSAWPCLYENTNTGYVRFMRDRRAVDRSPERIAA